jgi:GTP cyclohydrolase I
MTKQDNIKKIIKNLSESGYEKHLNILSDIKSFQAAENVYMSEETRAVMTLEASKKLEEFFDTIKLDYKRDENLKDTPMRVASMYINELMVGRYTAPPRIEAFPADMYKTAFNVLDGDYIIARDVILTKLENIEEKLYRDNSIEIKTNKLLMYSEELIEELENLNRTHGVSKPSIQTVVSKTIDINSLCSHHLISFVSTDDKDSKCTITYIPTLGSEKALLGISKLQRVADWFGRRPQLQEELNWQIKAFVSLILRSSDVMVSFSNIIHYCEKTRGVESHCGSTSSVVFGGRFKDPENRKLAYELTRN